MRGRNSTVDGAAGSLALTRRALLRAGAAAATGALAACGERPSDTAPVPAEILALHRESLVFDLHVDTLLWVRLIGYDIAARHEPPLPGASFLGQFDLPRAREGGLDGAVLALVVNPRTLRSELVTSLRLLARIERQAGIEQTLASLDLLAETARAHPDAIEVARSGSALRRAIGEGRFAALAGLEGAHGLEGRIENLRDAFERGLRMVGLVHFQASAAAYPMTAPRYEAEGLTPFGFELLAELEALGCAVDLAHLNARGVDDALSTMTRPFVVSHTACRALQDDDRNLGDDQIRRIARRGGVVGLAVGRRFVGDAGLERFLDHVEHALRVGGTGSVAIGSDWDGGISPTPGMRDVRALPRVTWGLRQRGWSEDVVRGVLGENALRALTDACG